MNWILLIIAGLFEVAFAGCLGKAKESVGMVSTYWYLGFYLCGHKYAFIAQGKQGASHRHCLCGLDGYWGSRHGDHWYLYIQRTSNFLALVFITTLIISIVGLKFVSH